MTSCSRWTAAGSVETAPRRPGRRAPVASRPEFGQKLVTVDGADEAGNDG
jgi:hypothetical protein